MRKRLRLSTRLANQMLKAVEPVKAKVKQMDFLHSGSTNLNLVLSGKPDGGWARGRVLNLVGDGSSGKTLEALELSYWCWKYIKKIKAKKFPAIKNVKIIYNNAEEFMDLPVERMYGEKFYKDVDWRHKSTPEAAIRDVAREVKSLKKGTFLLYIIDSWDALQPLDEKKKFEKAMKDESEMKAAQIASKASNAQIFFKWLVGSIDGKDATILVISQVKDIIGATYGPKKRRSGGSALDFYTHQVLWLREVEKMTVKRLGVYRVYGIRVEGKLKRSKVSKPFRTADFQILYAGEQDGTGGIDDVGSMVDFLYGPKKMKKLVWEGKKFKTRKKFLTYIEENNLECDLVEKVTKRWNKIEEASDMTAGRKRRF
jgi:RecA/RadA recombinase